MSSENGIITEKPCACGATNKSNAMFCSDCGHELKETKPEAEETQLYFCEQCGNGLAKEDIFCNKCGTRIAGEKAESSNARNEEVFFCVKNIIENYDVTKRKTLVKVLSFVVLIFFLLPFVKKSALGFDLSMTGVETAFGTFFSESTRDMASSEDIPANIFVLLSLLSCGVAVIYCCQLKEINKSIGGFHIASAIFLIIYIISYSTYYGETDWDFLISVEHGFAVWAIIFINAIAGIVALASASQEMPVISENRQEAQAENSLNPTNVSERENYLSSRTFVNETNKSEPHKRYSVCIYDEEKQFFRKETREIDIIKFPPEKYSENDTYYAIEMLYCGEKIRIYCTKKNWHARIENMQ